MVPDGWSLITTVATMLAGQTFDISCEFDRIGSPSPTVIVVKGTILCLGQAEPKRIVVQLDDLATTKVKPADLKSADDGKYLYRAEFSTESGFRPTIYAARIDCYAGDGTRVSQSCLISVLPDTKKKQRSTPQGLLALKTLNTDVTLDVEGVTLQWFLLFLENVLRVRFRVEDGLQNVTVSVHSQCELAGQVLASTFEDLSLQYEVELDGTIFVSRKRAERE